MVSRKKRVAVATATGGTAQVEEETPLEVEARSGDDERSEAREAVAETKAEAVNKAMEVRSEASP